MWAATSHCVALGKFTLFLWASEKALDSNEISKEADRGQEGSLSLKQLPVGVGGGRRAWEGGSRGQHTPPTPHPCHDHSHSLGGKLLVA